MHPNIRIPLTSTLVKVITIKSSLAWPGLAKTEYFKVLSRKRKAS